ncbi:MAG: dockerin type I repeat-containing protein [Clostridia bacterium]|nr:dockerin type I repeat-containing protein [Clostridia bacterium]
MKKAKRLLAVLLAVIMIASAACLPVYAKINDDSFYSIPSGVTNNGKYYFDAEKGCAYLLDMLDEMLMNAHLKIEVESIITLDFTSIDEAVNSIYDLIDKVDSGIIGWIADMAIGDLTRKENLQLGTLDDSIDRGTRGAKYRDGGSDLAVLYNVLGWLNSNTWCLQQIFAGTMALGLLNDTVYNLEIAGVKLLDNPDEGVKSLLYNLLIDSTTHTVPSGMTIDDMIQQLLNWALVDGTGTSTSNGGYSLLGMNHQPLMPVLKDANKYPGQVNIRGVELKTDSNGDGVADTIIDRNNDGVADKMDVYQLVNNLINGLLNGILAPELGGMVADLVGVEITDQYPGGDPAILTDVLFSTILGAVEGLLVQNGADPIYYSEEEGKETPMGKINDLVNWLFNGSNGGKPALYTFINIDYYGIGLTDNFVSLLNDLVRLAINLLPALGIELPENSGLPTADELTESNWYKINEDGTKEICDEGDEGVEGQVFRTYKGERRCYAIYADDEKKEIEYYAYFDNDMPVNTADENAADYEVFKFIRPDYKIPMDNVWAALVKMLFGMFVEGPYFPEWATTMEAVLAYGCAGLAVSILPEENFYKRLDAYHYNGNLPGEYTYPEETTPTKVIPYSDDTARSVSSLPTGAMNILSSVAAYYLNTMLNLEPKEKLTTHDTSFEQLLTELGLWGFMEYVPILAGEPDSTGDAVAESDWTDSKGVVHPAGTFAVYTNDLIDAVYSDFSERTKLADPDYDAIYTYLDNTLLSLIPETWLPDEFGSSRALFNDWLFGNLMEFDLQGILSIFSANPDGELAQPLLTVLLRVIDRVLAIVFGGNALMLPTDRSGIGSNSVYARNTTITSLDALIEDGDGERGDREVAKYASLPVLVGRLLTLLYKYRAPLFETFFPLLLSQSFERPFDHDALGTDASFVNVFGNDMTVYKIQDLEDQLDYLTNNINARFYGEYDTEAKAEEAVESLKDAYIETVEVTPATEENEAVYKYNVYERISYLESATAVLTPGGAAGDFNVYSNFGYKSVTKASTSQPLVRWDEKPYYFSAIEDNNPNGYYYSNYQDALEDAEAFVDSYYGFAQNELSNAFGEWLMYSVRARLAEEDHYDANGDGKAVLTDVDTDYAAPSTNTDGSANPGYPVDGYPSIPEAMYPYKPTSNTDIPNITWVDTEIDDYITQTRATFTEANYELLAMALEYSEDDKNYVELSLKDTEDVVRLALNTLDFDITPNSDGSYHGQYQWEDLQSPQLASIANFCSVNSMYFKYSVEEGIYIVYRKPFDYITDNFYLSKINDTDELPTAPMASRVYSSDIGALDEAKNAVYDGYVEYVDTIYSMRRSLYNQLGILNWRMEEAEKYRKTVVDTTMLEWARDHVKHAYTTEEGLRNRLTDDVVDGVTIYKKVYTQKTYEAFRNAYDFADCLIKGKASATGMTQSMVSEAFYALLETYNAIKPHLGDADWVQFNKVLGQANDLADPDGIRNDPVLGYVPESIAALDEIIAEANTFYTTNKETYDYENQEEIDSVVSRLETAILALKYRTDPILKPSDTAGEDVDIIQTAKGARTFGHVIGLVEGRGITKDLVQEYGMVVNETVGNAVTVEESINGLGTGAYFKGTIGDIEKFRYYAVLYGDLNGDARIDGTDWSRLRYAIVTQSNETVAGLGGDYIFEAADVNHDGFVTDDDAIIIRDYYNYAAEIDQGEHSKVEETVAL